MFNVIYRWNIKPGKEEQFQTAWAEATELIRKHRGGLGSRLHRCSGGTFLAYAQWPDQRTWECAASIPILNNEPFTKMNEAIASNEEPIKLNMIGDLLVKDLGSR